MTMAKMATFGQRWPRLQPQLDNRSYNYIRWITTFFTRPSVVHFANSF
jgi:hypothetical protein